MIVKLIKQIKEQGITKTVRDYVKEQTTIKETIEIKEIIEPITTKNISMNVEIEKTTILMSKHYRIKLLNHKRENLEYTYKKTLEKLNKTKESKETLNTALYENSQEIRKINDLLLEYSKECTKLEKEIMSLLGISK